MRARVKEKREVAKGTLLVVFDLLGREVEFKPGEYFWVTLLDPPELELERHPASLGLDRRGPGGAVELTAAV